jgi:transcription-repair coupling factor (superfamily II helicase)
VQAEEIRPEIHLGLPAYLPETYMDDEHQRLGTYKHLSLAAADEEVFGIRDELIDCFGPMPPEADNLFEVIRIRNRLKQIRVQKMGYDGRQFLIAFSSQSPIDPARIVDFVNASAQGTARGARPGHIRKGARTPALRGPILTPDLKLYVPAEGLQGGDILRKAVDIIRHLTTKDTMCIDVRPIF